MDVETPAADSPLCRLPLLRNFEDAEAFFEKEKDPFYLAAFLIQCWLGGLLTRAAAEYAENKNPKDRSLQRGESWTSFVEMFGLKPQNPCRYLLSCLIRFSISDNSPGNPLRHALVPLTIEHRSTGDYLGPKTMNPFAEQTGPSSPTLHSALSTRNCLIRWCDWLDAEIHLRSHRRWHESPASFDPDPETRHLAALGNAQRHLAKLDERAKACWLIDFTTAAEQYQNSPKWSALGKAMADQTDRPWLYPDVDTLVISLWPLVKAHNWTYRDLLNVIRPALVRPVPTPNSSVRTSSGALRTPHFIRFRTQISLGQRTGFCHLLRQHSRPPQNRQRPNRHQLPSARLRNRRSTLPHTGIQHLTQVPFVPLVLLVLSVPSVLFIHSPLYVVMSPLLFCCVQPKNSPVSLAS